MFELSIEREFCAAHAITISGVREQVHGHNWRVTVVVAGESLDDDGLLCDFHDVERCLDRALDAFRDRDLNATPPFDRLNPTAEHVARHIAHAVAATLPAGSRPAARARLSHVSVTEAPGCCATYRMIKR